MYELSNSKPQLYLKFHFDSVKNIIFSKRKCLLELEKDCQNINGQVKSVNSKKKAISEEISQIREKQNSMLENSEIDDIW